MNLLKAGNKKGVCMSTLHDEVKGTRVTPSKIMA